MKNSCIALFNTTHMAVLFEKTCRSNGFSVRIIPVPRHLSASCGLACRFDRPDIEAIRSLAAEHNIEVAEYHENG